MRLIDADALLEKATVMTEYDEGGWGVDLLAVPLCDVKTAPAVDAVEVVRCRYCEYWMKAKVNKKGFLICPASGMEITATDFCSYAEKRKCHYDR